VALFGIHSQYHRIMLMEGRSRRTTCNLRIYDRTRLLVDVRLLDILYMTLYSPEH
jgi:hypothetical protein